ncbi:hypothetical protein H6H03_37445 [Nostoc paludosum FACHB-159]|uniref:Uncharacterized protein n=1 Tax=Nostoc paludosum FACHB-159 TaxID=2692908 RepID=A0ABR8KLH9_9NOSO|nr:hypothetical protein [Nostoc paludosum]MBD2739479.1 hypothetical protein [Nostoc paludosum FACHB-159]
MFAFLTSSNRIKADDHISNINALVKVIPLLDIGLKQAIARTNIHTFGKAIAAV